MIFIAKCGGARIQRTQMDRQLNQLRSLALARRMRDDNSNANDTLAMIGIVVDSQINLDETLILITLRLPLRLPVAKCIVPINTYATLAHERLRSRLHTNGQHLNKYSHY